MQLGQIRQLTSHSSEVLFDCHLNLLMSFGQQRMLHLFREAVLLFYYDMSFGAVGSQNIKLNVGLFRVGGVVYKQGEAFRQN